MFERDLIDALSGLAADTGQTGAFRALLGRGDGSGAITNPAGLRPCEAWCHRPGGTPFLAVIGSNVPLTYDDLAGLEGVEVLVAYPAGEDLPEIVKITNRGMGQLGNRTPLEQLVIKAYYPTPDRLSDLRVEPTAPASRSVKIAGCRYTQPSTGDLNIFPDTVFDVGDVIDAIASGKHRVAWVCLDYETGTPQIVSTSDQTPSGTLPSRLDFAGSDISTLAVTSTYKRSVPVYLYDGQTEIVEADFRREFDARLDYPLPSILTATADELREMIWLGVV